MQLKSFEHYRDRTSEIGFVERFSSSLVEVRGLPGVRSREMVLFESGALGQVLSFDAERVRVLVLTSEGFAVGDSVARMDEELAVGVGDELLGTVIDPLGRELGGTKSTKSTRGTRGREGEVDQVDQVNQVNQVNQGEETLVNSVNQLTQSTRAFRPASDGEVRFVDQVPVGIAQRKGVTEPLHTGVTMVDFLVPLARGQRELIIGDRKSGKSRFVLSALKTQVRQGAVGVYAAVGKKTTDIKRVESYLSREKLTEKVVVVASTAADPSGLIYLTPFTAMTVAEYFRDKGNHVVVVLDDLTTQAKFYREVMLLASRFPGRNSYPGDVFHAQARVVERAGVFKNGTISLLPVAETVQGNLTGYIQTNLMAMTDGHLYFDAELYDRGRRPALNPFLSVTRVGLSPQPQIFKSLQRELMQLLVRLRKVEEFVHFGAETGAHVQTLTALGERLRLVLEESELFEGTKGTPKSANATGQARGTKSMEGTESTRSARSTRGTRGNGGFVSKNLKAYLLALLWINAWKDEGGAEVQQVQEVQKVQEVYLEKMAAVIKEYKTRRDFRAWVDNLFTKRQTFSEVVEAIRAERAMGKENKIAR